VNNDGSLDKEEAIKFMRNTFTGTPAAQFDRMFVMMDDDGSGNVDKNELAHFMRENCS